MDNNLQGKTFGRWHVVKYAGKDKYNNHIWECMCQCENNTIRNVSASRLKNGYSKSCGCRTRENNINKYNLNIHTAFGKRLYRIYYNMKTRCYNSNHEHYHNYGGRGIIICDKWLKSFDVFYYWSLKNGYENNLSIDRINNNGNYEPNNCRWILKKYQFINKRDNVFIEIDGITKTISEWAKETGLGSSTISYRYHNNKKGKDLISPVIKASKKSGVKGITWHKKGYWQVNYENQKSKSFKELNDAIIFLNEVKSNE